MKYDVAIIGSGIGGSSLSTLLARQGLKVIVFEGGSHPRFTIGESMILETSEAMRALVEFYDVPQLAFYSSENFYNQIGTQHGVKRHFSFVHHTPGEPLDVSKTLQAVIPKLPYGHEIHIARQDSDYFLTSIAITYGATVLQNTLIKDILIAHDEVEIVTQSGKIFHAEYIVDEGGMNSILARKMEWRHKDLLTHSRTIFTHMVDVPGFNEVSLSQREYGHPFPLSQGTLHHIFKGGWLWIIPFNNHASATNPLCSVGLQLDPRIYPQRNDKSPEEEFREFLERFPEIHAQLKNARPVRDFVRTDRLQYSAHHIVGDRFALLAHAAGFIDPLFSKGLYITHAQIFLIADLLLKAKGTGDFSAKAFKPLEPMTLDFIKMHDRLVSSAYKSWHNVKLWKAYSVLWLLGSYLEYLSLVTNRFRSKTRDQYISLMRGHKLVGGGFVKFFELQEKIDALMDKIDCDSESEVDNTVAKMHLIFRSFPWMSSAFTDLLKGKNHLPDGKINFGLVDRLSRFMGNVEYRSHFFGKGYGWAFLKRAFEDRSKYSAASILSRKKTSARLAR